MTDPLVEITESCRCGSSTTVRVKATATARRLVEGWRRDHLCLDPAALADARRNGASVVTGLAGVRPLGVGSAPEIAGPYRR